MERRATGVPARRTGSTPETCRLEISPVIVSGVRQQPNGVERPHVIHELQRPRQIFHHGPPTYCPLTPPAIEQRASPPVKLGPLPKRVAEVSACHGVTAKFPLSWCRRESSTVIVSGVRRQPNGVERPHVIHELQRPGQIFHHGPPAYCPLTPPQRSDGPRPSNCSPPF